ncbi:MAG: hypothetical protein AAFQ41_07370 [Cyanobacteria bacterium J06623_7]
MSEKPKAMPIFSSWLKRGKRHFKSIPILIWSNALTIFILSMLSIYAKIKSKGSGIESLFSDPFSYNIFYLGWFTSVSEILWCAAIAICLFSALLLPKSRRSFQTFLWGSSIVMLVLFLDDRFRLTLLLCEFFGVCKLVKLSVYSIYGLLLVSYALLFRNTISRTPYIPLLISFFLFGFSSAIDIAPIGSRGIHAMLEDGTKLIGLINLTIYFWWVCQHEVKKNIVQK